MSLSTMTTLELTRSVSAPISDDDYGVHPPRGPYPEAVLPDIEGVEYLPPGSVAGTIDRLRREVERLKARVAELESGR